jgi:signal transduction histidine kinase
VLSFVSSVAEVVEAATGPSVDAALLDLMASPARALDGVKALRQAAPHLPLVVVTADSDEHVGRAAISLGAQDFLIASELAPRSLERSLRYAGDRLSLQRALQGERADLAASRASMVGLIEANADGLIVLDRAGMARFANPAAEILLGRGEKELVGQQLGLLLESERAAEIELRSRDGQLRVAEVRIAPVNWDGEPAFLASLRDVTERKRGERTTSRSAESFRALAEAAPDPIVVHRGDVVVWVNRAFTRLMATGPHGALDYGHVSSWLEISERDRHIFLAPEPTGDAHAALLRTPSGVQVPVEVRNYRVVFDGVDVTLTLLHDLAAREKKARLRAQRERLAALGRLAANLGHEINNPLSYVVSNLSFLSHQLSGLSERLAAATAEELQTPRTAEHTVLAAELEEACSAAADALEGAERVAAIVRDVRVLSRNEGRELNVVRIPDVVQSALRIARGKLVEVAHVSLDLKDVPSVRANDTALLQVFVNLLVNAADACSELAAERHEVDVACFTDGDGRAVVEVRDSGPGISQEVRDHLFEPFFTTKPAGSGFGLAISFAIVESLGGSLVLESRGPRGAVARIVLPPAPFGPPAVLAEP